MFRSTSNGTFQFNEGIYLLFDDDCNVCTSFAKTMKKLFWKKLKIVPMHLSSVKNEGIMMLGDDYWKSFHIVDMGKWFSEIAAITNLLKIMPLGKIFGCISEFPPAKYLLLRLLRYFQASRRRECIIQ